VGKKKLYSLFRSEEKSGRTFFQNCTEGVKAREEKTGRNFLSCSLRLEEITKKMEGGAREASEVTGMADKGKKEMAGRHYERGGRLNGAKGKG